MYQPTTRVLTVLELLQAHPQISGTQLAKYLEVDVRSVRRYITMLQDLGIPVEADTGRHGGYRLRPGFKPPPLIFSEDEVLAVAVGLIMVNKVGINTEAGAVESAVAKIGRILPAKLREQVQAIQENLIVDFADTKTRVAARFVTRLNLAVQQQRQILLIYQDGEERTVDSYGVLYRSGRWYLVGYCHLRKGIRNFRLDRMQKVELLATTFIPPSNFSALEYLINAIATIPDTWNVEVVVKATLEELRRVIPPTLATLEEHAEGTLFKASFDDLDRLARMLIGFGYPILSCEPKELKEAFVKVVNELKKLE
jgi:predicted DNA-binding transcriptional regulator YafY